MGDTVMIDAGELTEFGRRIAQAKTRADIKIAKSVRKGAQNVKTTVETDVGGSSNKGIARIRVGYELGTTRTTVFADIAPRDGGASNLANIAFFGTAKGGGTHRFYEHAEQELPVLADYVADAGVDAIREAIGL